MMLLSQSDEVRKLSRSSICSIKFFCSGPKPCPCPQRRMPPMSWESRGRSSSLINICKAAANHEESGAEMQAILALEGTCPV